MLETAIYKCLIYDAFNLSEAKEGMERDPFSQMLVSTIDS